MEARIFCDERSMRPKACVLMSRQLEATMLRQFCSQDKFNEFLGNKVKLSTLLRTQKN